MIFTVQSRLTGAGPTVCYGASFPYIYHHMWKYRVILPQSLYIATVQGSTTVVCPFCDPTVAQKTIAMQRGTNIEVQM